MLLLYPVVLWVPFGPFLMAAMGSWCARRPGWRPRLWSVLLPLEPVAASATAMVLPLNQSWDETRIDDLVGYLVVYVGAITFLPWLLGYGITHAVRAVRARRARRAGARPAGAASSPEGGAPVAPGNDGP